MAFLPAVRMKMRVIKELILRDIVGEHILVPYGKAALSIKGMINLSESAAVLWQALETERSEDELVRLLLDNYEVDEQTARADVHQFTEKMLEMGIIEL